MKLFFLLLFIPFYAVSVYAQNRSINFEHGTMAEALTKATKENKLVFVDCFTVWCGPCKGMAATVFTQDSVADFFNSKFINVKMDMEKGEGIAMAIKYRVEAYPSFLLLDNKGTVVFKFVGGMTSGMFMAKIREGANPKNRIAIMDKRYADGDRSPALLRDYIKVKIEMLEKTLGKTIAEDYFKRLTPKERTLRENWFLFGENRYSMYLSNIYSSNFNYLADHWKEFSGTIPKDSIESKLGSSYLQIAGYCLRGWYFKQKAYDKNDFDRYLTQLQSTELKDKNQLIILMKVAQSAGEKDTATIVNLLADNIATFSEVNKKILFDFAFMFKRPVSALTKNIRCKEIFDKVIQTSSNKGLINTAEACRKNIIVTL